MTPLDEGSIRRREISTLQHNIKKTGINAIGGIRTRNYNKPAVTEMGQNSGTGLLYLLDFLKTAFRAVGYKDFTDTRASPKALIFFS